MTGHVPRLPLSLDPLIKEAKQRMRRRRLFLAFAVVALTAGLALTFQPRGAGIPRGVATGSNSALRLPSLDASCGAGQPRVRPRQVNFCGDGGYWLTRMHWTQWTAAGAIGKGTALVNGCIPDCARGTFHAYAVSVRLSRPIACHHRTTRAFALLRILRFDRRKTPTGAYNWDFGCSPVQ